MKLTEYLVQDINDFDDEIKTKFDIETSNYIIGKHFGDGVVLIMNSISLEEFARSAGNQKYSITWNSGLDLEYISISKAIKEFKHSRHNIDDFIVLTCYPSYTVADEYYLEYNSSDDIIHNMKHGFYSELERVYEYTMDEFQKFISNNRVKKK